MLYCKHCLYHFLAIFYFPCGVWFILVQIHPKKERIKKIAERDRNRHEMKAKKEAERQAKMEERKKKEEERKEKKEKEEQERLEKKEKREVERKRKMEEIM